MFTQVSLSGCGWKVFWYFGVIQKLLEHRLIDTDRVEFITASAGGGVAMLFLMGLDGYDGFKKTLFLANAAKKNKRRHTVKVVSELVSRMTPPDIHTTRRITVCYSKVSLWPFEMKYEMRNEFESKEDMFEAWRASCSIPLANDIVRFKDMHLFVDAGLVCNQPSNHVNTLRISANPFSFGSDIRPAPSSLFDYTIDIPTDEVAEKMFNQGLRDGEKFSLKYGDSRSH